MFRCGISIGDLPWLDLNTARTDQPPRESFQIIPGLSLPSVSSQIGTTTIPLDVLGLFPKYGIPSLTARNGEQTRRIRIFTGSGPESSMGWVWVRKR
jgi:hypothetical protein